MSESVANNERMNTIYYFRRQNYGNTQFYFALKRHRNAFGSLTDKKTFTQKDLDSLVQFADIQFKEVLESSAETD
jgi:hypothetical protein